MTQCGVTQCGVTQCGVTQCGVTPGQRELRRARAYLSRVAEAPAPALSELISEVGPVRAARLVAAGQVPGRVAAETGARGDDDRAEQVTIRPGQAAVTH